MAEQTTVFTLKVNGVDTEIKNFQQLQKAIKSLETELDGADFGTRKFVQLNQELEKAREATGQFNKEAGKLGLVPRALKAIQGGTKLLSNGFKGLGAAIKATGFGFLLQIGAQLADAFVKLEVVRKPLEVGFAALGAVVGEVGDLISGLFKAVVRFFSGDLVGAVNAAQDAFTNFNPRGAVEDAIGATRELQSVEEAYVQTLEERNRLQRQIETANARSEDQTLSAEERITALNEAQGANNRLLEINIDLQRRRVAALELANRANTTSLEDQQKEAEARAELDSLQAQFAKNESELNKKTQAIRQQSATQAAAFAKARQDQINAEIDALTKAANLEADVRIAQLEGIETVDAQRERALLEAEKQFNEIEARRLKGEQINANEELLINIALDKKLAAIDAAEAKRLEDDLAAKLLKQQESAQKQIELSQRVADANQRIAELDLALLEEVAQSETVSFAERIAANERLAQIQRDRIELDRQIAVQQKDLTQAEIDAINFTADAQIAALNRANDEANAILENQEGSFLARLFGLGNEEQLNQLREGLTQALGELQNLVLGALDGLLQAQVDRYNQQAALAAAAVQAAEAEVTQSLQREANLRQQLTQADASQRQGIIKLIDRERAAQAKADAEANASRKREREAKQKAFEAEQRAAIVQAVTNAAQAVLRVFASTGPPTSFILAGITAAQTAAQVAAIRSQPTPQFAAGGYTGAGFGKPDSSGFKPAGYVHEGEWVAPKWQLQSPTYAPLISYLEAGRERGFADGGFTSEPPQVGTNVPEDFTRAVQGIEELAKRPVVVSVQAINDVDTEVQTTRVRATL